MRPAILAILLSLSWLGPAQAEEGFSHAGEAYVAYAFDSVVTRPFTLALTVTGMAVYLAGLPFIYPTRDPTAFDVLVRTPAEATFRRCLACPIGQRAP